jgi:hypothetical protein
MDASCSKERYSSARARWFQQKVVVAASAKDKNALRGGLADTESPLRRCHAGACGEHRSASCIVFPYASFSTALKEECSMQQTHPTIST